MLIGVNGVGKSTVANALATSIPDATVISGSSVLMEAFGGLTRSQLERLSPEEKMRLMVPAVLDAFERHRSAPAVLFDTHLVVTIRASGRLVLENIWSDAYRPYLRHLLFLMGEPKDIRDRRLRDFELTGRKRDAALEHIMRDQEVNLAVFQELAAHGLPASQIFNEENGLAGTVEQAQCCLKQGH